MTVRFLLDTPTCANVMKRMADGVMRRLAELPVAEVGISSITHSELLAGAMQSRQDVADQTVLDLFMRHVAVLPYPAEASEQYAAIRYAPPLLGGRLEENELLIAAHARCLRLALVSCDAARYRCVPGLAVEDWGRVKEPFGL